MKVRIVLRWIIVFVIIIGGVLIIVPPKPEPDCIVCGQNFSRIAGVINVILGFSALAVLNKIKEEQFR